MAHSENSNMIRRYIADFEAERITLSQLWYNIQTPLHLLFQKEELLHVQEERLKEVKSYNILWQTEYKQKEAALAQFVKFSTALKAEIVELKKQQEYWYVEKVAQEKKEIDLKAEISVLKNKLDSLKELFLHNEEAESCEYENKETALRAEISDLKDELDSLKAAGVGLEEEQLLKDAIVFPSQDIHSFRKLDDHYHHGNDIKTYENKKCSGRYFKNMEEVVKMAIQIGAEGFTISPAPKCEWDNSDLPPPCHCWFHSTVDDDRIGYEGNPVKGCKEDKHKGLTLYIKK